MLISKELSNLIIVDVKNDIISQLMDRFDNEIIPLEDAEDPMKPSLFREEFQSFLEETVTSSIKVNNGVVSFGVGNEEKLGFSRDLDENTTDGIKIIGTILQGISGEYVLVTSALARSIFGSNYSGNLGRTGEAYLMKKSEYDIGVDMHNWPRRKAWRFSNFPGIPDFFDKIDLDMDKYIMKLIEAI